MNFNNIKSFAKINLSLGVTGDLELVISVENNLYDEIKIKKIFNTNHKIKFLGKFSNKIKKQNTVSNLFKILDEKSIK